MTLKQAIKVLQTHQKWRKGAKVKPPNPKELTEALDIAVNLLKGLETNKKGMVTCVDFTILNKPK